MFNRLSSLRLNLIQEIATARLYSALASNSTSRSKSDWTPSRSYLYVPASSEKMLRKSLETPSDMIIYDLEDSVAPSQKDTARGQLMHFLTTEPKDSLPVPSRIAVRINSIPTPQFEHDLKAVVDSNLVETLVLPKIHSVNDLDFVSRLMSGFVSSTSSYGREYPLRVVASIESAGAIVNVQAIASWKSVNPRLDGVLRALLFAAEDYCADTSIIRTPGRQELLYTRSKIVNAAKAYKLEAIDMVCVNYKDPQYLLDECEDGRRLGFTGKQAIHPVQVETIHNTFVPTRKEIARAARIVEQMKEFHESKIGAFGLDDGKGGLEMIDAPMVKQAENTLKLARAAGLSIPGN